MPKILISGGSGFIGTNLINYLLKKKYKITNIDKLSYASTPKKFIRIKKNYSFSKFNIRNKKKISKILKKKFDFIIHLAAESHVDRSIDSPKKFFTENVISSLNLYNSVHNLVKNNKIFKPKIIHISTDEVYGSLKKGYFNEKSGLKPNSPYSASKAATELIAKTFIKTFKLEICILRLTNNYGPYQFTEKFIPKIISQLKKNKKIPLYGNGLNIREWIYVEDSCSAIEKIIKKFKNNKVYNIGSNIRINNLNLIKKILKIYKITDFKKCVEKVVDRPGHDFRYALDSRLFRKQYKWKPKYKLNEGLKKTIKWYRTNKQWWDLTQKKTKI